MIVNLVGGRTYWEHADRLANAFRWSGELAYLAVPLAVGLAVAIPWKEARGKAALVLSALAAGLVTIGMALWSHVVGPDLPDLLYGATRLDFLPDDDFILYAIPLGIGWAVTVAAMLSKDPFADKWARPCLLLARLRPRSRAADRDVLGVPSLPSGMPAQHAAPWPPTDQRRLPPHPRSRSRAAGPHWLPSMDDAGPNVSNYRAPWASRSPRDGAP